MLSIIYLSPLSQLVSIGTIQVMQQMIDSDVRRDRDEVDSEIIEAEKLIESE